MLSSNSCVICDDYISDPVCRSCYIKQINVLLNDLEIHPVASEIILDKIKNKFPIESLNDTECILCNKDNISICRYCFSIILKNILEELNLPEDLIEYFGYSSMYRETSLEDERMSEIEIVMR